MIRQYSEDILAMVSSLSGVNFSPIDIFSRDRPRIDISRIDISHLDTLADGIVEQADKYQLEALVITS